MSENSNFALASSFSKVIREIASEKHQALIQIRRHLHQHPELGYEECETTPMVYAQVILDLLNI